MKKILFILVLYLGFNSFLPAQRLLKIIPSIGVNLSYFNDDFDGEALEGKPGFQIGADIRIGNKLYIAPGVHYLRQSNRFYSTDGVLTLGSYDETFTTQGLRIPVMIGGDIMKSDRWGIRAFAGPSFSLLFSEDDFFDQLADWERKDTILGIDLGVGLDLGIITIDLLHEWGVNELVQWEGVNSSSRAFFLSLGILF